MSIPDALTPAGRGFGTALRTARERRELSQRALSERADCDPTYISRIETGERRPTTEIVDRLASALQLGSAEGDLFYGAAGIARHEGASGELVALAALLEDPDVPELDRQAVRTVLVGLASWLGTLRTAARRPRAMPKRDTERLKAVHLPARENGALRAQDRVVEAI